MAVVLDDLNLHKAERLLCERALAEGGTIVEAAKLLGITRHALKRRIIKHQIPWPPKKAAEPPAPSDGPALPPSSFAAAAR